MEMTMSQQQKNKILIHIPFFSIPNTPWISFHKFIFLPFTRRWSTSCGGILFLSHIFPILVQGLSNTTKFSTHALSHEKKRKGNCKVNCVDHQCKILALKRFVCLFGDEYDQKCIRDKCFFLFALNPNFLKIISWNNWWWDWQRSCVGSNFSLRLARVSRLALIFLFTSSAAAVLGFLNMSRISKRP